MTKMILVTKPYLLTAVASFCIAAAGTAQAQVTQTVLHVFGIGTDGGNPTGNLLADNTGPSGSLRGLYGTASAGANQACAYGGCGMAFKLAPPKAGQTDWKESALWNFTGNADGANPLAGLFATTKRIKADTALYSTAYIGGTSNAGTVFALTGKKLTTLWAFTGGSDGGNPAYGDVVADKSGDLYVAALNGGQSGCGTVIELTPPANGQTNWSETTIWTFTGTDACQPNGVIIDASGALYGTGEGNGNYYNDGSVFKLIPPHGQQTAWTEQTLWVFGNNGDGLFPSAPLTAGKKGVLYGTTALGDNNDGVVFSLTPPKNGNEPYTEQVLWRFTGGNDGGNPMAPVILDKSGALYGTASNFDINGDGSVFKLSPSANGQGAWTETTLWDFSGPDGANPAGSLAADKNGVLYGTTYAGGSGTNCDSTINCGVAFSLAGTGFEPK